MPSKPKRTFQCNICQYETTVWYGRCPNCQNWDSFQEIQKKPETVEGKYHRIKTLIETKTIAEILSVEKDTGRRFLPFKSDILNEFWNEGLVNSSLTLLAGEPGLGKSTLSLQLIRSLKQANPDVNIMYVTAEEAEIEVANRAKRLEIPKEIFLLQANHLSDIIEQIQEVNPQIVVIDSIQTIISDQVGGSPGSVTQVSYVASSFLELAKSTYKAVILIGHVTKDGQVAGPKTLEHLVDSVLYLEESEVSGFRTLGFSKHRFGSTENELLLKMEETGMQIITDPSLALLENLESGVGVCYGLALEKNLPLIVEIQALVGNSQMSGFGRREALGIKNAKLNTLLAVIEKYLDIDLKSREVYIQVTGLPKNLTDDSLDMPIILAILSSIYGKSIGQLLNLRQSEKAIFSARINLTGRVRQPTKLDLREKVAKKLNFILNQNINFSNLKDLLKNI